MDIFTYVFVVKFEMCVWKDKNKWKRGRGGPIFLKKIFGKNLANEQIFIDIKGKILYK